MKREIARLAKNQLDPNLKPPEPSRPRVHQAGKRELPAVCPTCRQSIQRGQWVTSTRGLLKHAYNRCPGVVA